MKIALQYEVVVHDDNGELLADAQAKLNVTSIEALVQTIVTAMAGTMSTIDKIDSSNSAVELSEMLSRMAKPHTTQEN